MPEPIEITAIVNNVEEKSGARKDGKGEWHIVKAWFVDHPSDKGAVSSFSTTVLPVLQELQTKKTPAVFTLEEQEKEFQGKHEYDIKKIAGTDGKLLYEPEKKQNKNYQRTSNPEWSFRTPEERAEERRSIEAQTALQYATRTMESAIQYSDLKADDAIGFVKHAFAEYVQLIRGAASRGADSGSQSLGAVGRQSEPGVMVNGQPSTSAPGIPAGSSPSSRAGEVRTDGLPSSESAPVDASVHVDTSDLDAITGSPGKTKLAFKKHFGLDPIAENMTIERLTELAGTLLASA